MPRERLLVIDDIQEVVQLHGNVRFRDGSMSSPVLLRIQHPRYDTTRMSCEVIGPGGFEGLSGIGAANEMDERIADVDADCSLEEQSAFIAHQALTTFLVLR